MSRFYDEEEQHPLGSHNDRYLDPEAATRPLNGRRRHGRDERDDERPRLQRNCYSGNEAVDYRVTEIAHDWDHDRNLLGRSSTRNARQRSSKQVPSPPRFDRVWDSHPALPAPSPPPAYPEIIIPGEGDSTQSRRKQIPSHSLAKQVPSPPPAVSYRGDHDAPRITVHRGNFEELVHAHDDPESHPGRPLGSRKTTPYAKRIPSPPAMLRRRKDPEYYSYTGPDTLENYVDTRIRSVPGRLSPPSPPAVLPSIAESGLRPRRKKSTSRPKRVHSPSETPLGKQAPSPPASSYQHDNRNASYRIKSTARVPSPPSYNQRRHSDMDVPSTRRERLHDALSAGQQPSRYQTPDSLQRDKKATRGDRVQSLQVPLSIPGSFPSPPDTIKPEDSRSETSPPRRLSSGDTRSLASGSSLRPSISPSVSGVLGENVYRYKPLGAFQFRLVRILPKTMSLVKCELVHCSLDDPPSYTAISYAWGDADDKRRIQLEGAEIPVSASLHGALTALRAKKESVLVWVDALSIDQQNREERTQQVQLMTYIYSRAVTVAVWLGPEADDSNVAMRTLSEVANHAGSSERIDSLMSSKAGKSQFASVVALFERDYWNRLWVVQEVFNAKEITVYCGHKSLPWTVYRRASSVFWRHKAKIDYYFPGGLSHGGQRASPSQFTYSQVLGYHGPSGIPDVSSFSGLGEESLLEVMRVCRRKLSADPKDKLYGILGLLDEEIRNEFPVDYGLSVKEVYVRVFDYLLCTTERLEVLCEAVHFPLHTSSNLPSWVPDWSHNPDTTALGRSCEFWAAGSTRAEARVLDDRRRLELSAVYLDTISAHGIAVGTLCTLADYIMAFLHWRALLLGSDDDGESQARQEEFCRTLSLDQTPSNWKGSWKKACYHVFASLAHDRLARLPLDDELWQYIDADVGIDAKDRRRFLQENFGSRMMGRCFCLTEDGSIGMGSGFMAAGDMVVVPLGCPTPILLRPEGPRGEYRYVGDVYIHGYMRGEAVDHWKTGERELHKYVLH